MEDFVREINRTSSVFLLYGNNGVGKSRLLKQLTSLRLTEFKTYWVDFRQLEESGDGDNMTAQVERAAETASKGDVIVFDHFEKASNKAQSQIFKSWSTEGKDKNLNVIIATNNDGFKPFRQLAQQFQIEARSFQLMPCSLEEAEAYLQYSIFPEQALGELNITPPIKKRIRSANGVFTQLNEIILRDAGSFSIRSESSTSSLLRNRISIGLLALIVLLVTAVFWQSTPEQTIIMPDSEVAVADKLETKVVNDSEKVTTIKQEPDIPESPVEIELQEPTVEETIIDEVIVETEISENTDSVETDIDNDNWFPMLLETSLSWVKDSDQQRGTIQLMSMGYDNFDQLFFKNFLDELGASGFDVSQIRIFKTLAGEKILYSMIYSDYKSRREASRQIPELPDTLRANGPIARSIGSISKEISRFQETTEDD